MERARPFPDGIIPPPLSPLHDLNGSELTFVSCQGGSGGSGGGGDSEVVSSGGAGVEGAHYVTHKAPPLALNPPRTCQTRTIFLPSFLFYLYVFATEGRVFLPTQHVVRPPRRCHSLRERRAAVDSGAPPRAM